MRKFGIELEVSGVSKEQVAEALNAAGIEAVAENYNHRLRNYWKVTTDSSIRSENGLACEIVSPPLNYRESSFATIAKIVAILKEIGATVNESCGMHVHVDCRGINDPDFYRLLLTFYSKFENEIDSFVHQNRRENANTYCRTNKVLYDTWTRIWSSYADVAPTYLTDIFSNVERYYKLNFASFVRHGTVEFRQYQGTLDAKDIRAWVDFCINLVEHTATICSSASNKGRLRERRVMPTHNIPQLKDYVLATVNRFCPVINHEQFTDPYQAIKAFTLMPWTPPGNEFEPYTLHFSSTQINEIFKIVFMLIHHISLRATEQNANRENENTALRDLSFKFDEKSQVLLTAMFFNFHGTEEEVTRRANSKLANLGLYRNGRIHFDNHFFVYMDWCLSRDSIATNTINRNPYYRTLHDTNSWALYHRDRRSQISTITTQFINWTKRFFVNNPRSLRTVSDGSFASRRTNLNTEILSYLLQVKFMIRSWSIESNLRYNPLRERNTRQEENAFEMSIRNGNQYYELWINNLGHDSIFSSQNSEDTFDLVNKQPYFDLVDSIRTNEVIDKAFSGLADTSKVSAVHDEHADLHVREAIERVRQFIIDRNSPPPRPPRNRPIADGVRPASHAAPASRVQRVFTNIGSDIDNILALVESSPISSHSRTIIRNSLTGANEYATEQLDEAINELHAMLTPAPAPSGELVEI